ncbi:protein-lysine N-methyltransferase EEF2KMT [Monomorium pharaonis]|uniref:protein-lysine N-methyltransferase EEF2KMT n=1 Tax=Monomorium pharaonis TaxID=307658 RepID=UPI00063F5275|nr:protein-lysine N-methyltransferase EEF2KMT [Monomorium pharaonis]XP_028047156.1 protein-lysine N-methyltransferase EEF2KMT [Monomorium pharaonis]XP_036149324.1 protein-lysine N-methyltransferase EEF2KMT [Monomorium pharaonis]
MSYDTCIVNYLTKQFLCCTALIKMNFMASDEHEICNLNLEVQKQILDNTINSDLIKRYPIKGSYQKAFLKLLMQKIEEGGNEIHDDLYTAYCKLLSLPDDESVHYRHFLIENGMLNCITLKESTNLISEGTTGLCSWQGAVVLSQWCIENRGQFCGKNVLELGCGVGLTGMSVISVCTPKQYIFSDCHPIVLDMLCENVKLNFLSNERCQLLNASEAMLKLQLQIKHEQTNVQVIDLRWEDIEKYLSECLSQPDIIIAADILYESNSFGSLTSGLKRLLTLNNYAIFAATVRNEDTISQFLEHLVNYDLAFEECSLPKRIMLIQSIDVPVRILRIFQKI